MKFNSVEIPSSAADVLRRQWNKSNLELNSSALRQRQPTNFMILRAFYAAHKYNIEWFIIYDNALRLRLSPVKQHSLVERES